MARSYLALEQPEQARERLTQFIEADPDNVVALNLLAQVYLAMGDAAKAREQYAATLSKVPGSPIAYQQLARLHSADGDMAAAMATVEAGIAASERNPLLALMFGSMQSNSGNQDAAIAAFDEIVGRYLDAEAPDNNLALLLADHRSGEPESLARGRAITERLQDSQEPTYLGTAGWVQYRSGNFSRAVELLQQAAALGGAKPAYQYHLGIAYLASGRTEEAKVLRKRAFEAAPDDPRMDAARAALQKP